MIYKNVKITPTSWKNFRGKRIDGYLCEDKAFFSELSTKSITTPTLEEMMHFIDNTLENYESIKNNLDAHNKWVEKNSSKYSLD